MVLIYISFFMHEMECLFLGLDIGFYHFSCLLLILIQDFWSFIASILKSLVFFSVLFFCFAC